MVDKSFYKAAADEVAGGVVDDALWVKVAADMPGAEKVTHQAKYIQLRAAEMAMATRLGGAVLFWRYWGPQSFWQWLLLAVSVWPLTIVGLAAYIPVRRGYWKVTLAIVACGSAIAFGVVLLLQFNIQRM